MSSAETDRDVRPQNVVRLVACAPRKPADVVRVGEWALDHRSALDVISEAESRSMELRMAHVNACRAISQILEALAEGMPLDRSHACVMMRELEKRGRESFGALFAALAELDAMIQDDAARGGP